MQFQNDTAKITKVIPRKDTLRQINHAYLDVDENGKAHLVATTGYALAVHPVELDEDDAPGYIPADALKEVERPAYRKNFPSMGMSANGECVLGDGRKFPRPSADDLGKYPDWRRIVELAERGEHYEVALSAKYLYELAQAIDASKGRNYEVRLKFRKTPEGELDPNSMILVTATTSTATGVLIPCRM